MNRAAPATPKQVAYCKSLFRKVKLFYNCQQDEALVREVRERTGYDLERLTMGEAHDIIERLNRDIRRARGRLWSG